MSNLTPFLLVATLVAAAGVGSMTQAQPAQPASHAAALAQLSVAGHVAPVGPGVLVLAAR